MRTVQNFPAEGELVKLHRFAAVAVEVEIGVDMHVFSYAFAFFAAMIASRLQGPGPASIKYRKRKQ